MSSVSAGFIIRSADKYLIAHTTGHKDERSWTIPKGGPDENETMFDAACREVKEETGIDLLELEKEGRVRLLRDVRLTYKTGTKTVSVYLADDPSGELQHFKCKCTSMVESPDGDFPEVDEFWWVPLEAARELVFTSQLSIFTLNMVRSFHPPEF